MQVQLKCVGHTGSSKEKSLALLRFSEASVPQQAMDPRPGAGPGTAIMGPGAEWPAGSGGPWELLVLSVEGTLFFGNTALFQRQPYGEPRYMAKAQAAKEDSPTSPEAQSHG